MKIILFCQSLTVGGTQRQVALLAPILKRRGHDVAVAAFYRGGPFDAELSAAGIVIHDLKKRGRWDVVGFLARLAALLRRERPDILYAFLPVPNAVAGAMKVLVRRAPRVVFGVRSSRMRGDHYDWLIERQYGIEALLSRAADLVIVNSRDGLDDVAARHFHAGRALCVPNGIDTDRFAPDPAGRARLRAEWSIGDGETLVGQVARFDPMKGHDVFFAAAARLVHDSSWRFVCVGVDAGNLAAARQLAAHHGVDGRVVFAGARTDMSACYSAFDISCQASLFGEGFPNAVAEAMACGIPCVVTDVGDTRDIVDGLGAVVPAGDAAALAAALAAMRDRAGDRAVSAAKLRRSIIDRFGAESVAVATEDALQAILR